MIILNKEQADHVRGLSTPNAGLQPRELVDGDFALPEVVLTDPAHEQWWEYLAALPVRDVGDGEWLVVEEE